jgi:nucleobase:cation symporter-1, NCS1 family
MPAKGETVPVISPPWEEVPPTLRDAPPRPLGVLDQVALWGNLGVSLLLPVAAVFVFPPGMALGAALLAIVVGAVVGNTLLALAAVPGAETGAPS